MSQPGSTALVQLGQLFGVPPNHRFINSLDSQSTSTCGRYKILRKLRRGRNSHVYGCYDRLQYQTRVMKIITRRDEQTEAEHEYVVRREFDMQLRLSIHRNICTAHGLLQVLPDSYILMDLCDKDLEDLIQASRLENKPYNIKTLFLDVVDGVIHCHRNNVAHRHLSSHNIGLVYNEDGKSSAVLLDFGYAVTPLSTMNAVFRGRRQHDAPELQKPSPPQPIMHNWAASDIWSLGVLLFRMVTGRFPFYQRLDECVHYPKYQNGEKLQNRFPQISIELEDILRAIFKEDPSERIDLHQLRVLVLNCPNFYSRKGIEYTGLPHPRELETRHRQRPDQAPHFVQESYSFIGEHLSNT
ncbi:kinase-like domain-containing protein [Leptodontidium sp. 2 PMI_412]|nr:kinase-like domain-containing protein [Leptodontidium sp. 2 PMI_412]